MSRVMTMTLLVSSSSRCRGLRQRPWLGALVLLPLVLGPLSPVRSAPASSPPKAGIASSQRVVKPSPTLVQRLRELLGIAPALAVGGSRSADAGTVCLLAPLITRAQRGTDGVPTATLRLPAPTLLAAGPLNEVRLEKGDTMLWRERASLTQSIEGPLTWPLAPLRGGESLLLKLRPRGAAGGDFSSVRLQAAGAEELNNAAELVRALGQDLGHWQQQIERLASRDPGLAMALITSPQAPPALQAAARELRCRSNVR